MGDARRRQEMQGEKPMVVATCPVCKKEYVADGKSKLILTSYLVPQGRQGGQVAMAASLPKIACTGCGVEFYGEEQLVELRRRAAGERTNIIIPETRVKLN